MVNETLTVAAVGAAAKAVFAGAAQSLRLGLQARHGELSITEAIVKIAATSATTAVRTGTASGLAEVIEIGARNTDLLSPWQRRPRRQQSQARCCRPDWRPTSSRWATSGVKNSSIAVEKSRCAINSGAWAFGVVGKTVVPIPIVGALVGSNVGYEASAVIVEGFKLARIAAATADDAFARLPILETEVMVAIKRLEECRLALEATIAHDVALFESAILPSMDRLESALTLGRATDRMDALAALNLELGAKLDWVTLPKSEAFMADTTRPLQL